MADKGIDSNGLLYILQRIKANFALKSHTHATSDINSGNIVTGVKGNSESSYRTGQVNITAANVGAAASSHTHGNIQNGGTLQTTDITIGSGDKLVVTDSSDSNKIARTSAAFDGQTVRTVLAKSGDFVNIGVVDVAARGTTKAYLLATSTSPGNTSVTTTSLAETGVYLDTTAGKLVATSFAGSGASLTSLNGSNISSGTVAAARIANLDASKITSGTIGSARLPTASDTVKGGVIIGANLSMDGDILDAVFPYSSVDGITFGGDYETAANHFGVCSTAAGTATKAVTISAESFTPPLVEEDPGGDSYAPLTVLWVTVKFTVTNTAAVANLTLKVNDRTAKPIKYRGGNLPSAGTLAAGRVYFFVYDGTNFELIGDLDANTDTKVNVKARGTTKAYLLATSTSPTSSNQAVESLAETAVYLDTTAGKLVATSFSGSGASLTSLNGSNISSGTVAADRIASLAASKITSGTFDAARIPSLAASKITSGTFDAARLPAATSSAQGAMSAADKTKLDAFSAASDYALKSDITSMYRHKGSVADMTALNALTGMTAGDVYNVTATGMNYVYVDSTTGWDPLGSLYQPEWMSNSEIDTVFTSAGLTATS